MKVSMNWLKEYVNIQVSNEALLTMFSTHSQEVEYVEKLVDAEKLVVGQVMTCDPHPEADKLSVCDVDVGHERLQIICGAPNVKEGQRVIVALPGALLPGGLKIEKTEIRGVNSAGMICSLNELGIEHKYHHEEGIHVIKEAVEIGSDALGALELDDTVLALDLTPNRSDLLSMHGVAYDVSAMFEVPLVIEEPHIGSVQGKNPMNISTTTDLCHSYYGRVIDNLIIKQSPRHIQSRLIAAGIRPINNVVDITNYVMLETGQPLHAFDLDLLESSTIVVREAEPKEEFVTLDDKKRILQGGEILITNGKKAVALGGVMGGADTEVHSQTKRILLESAVFDALSISKTSRRLDLRSESSLRFERKVDPQKTLFALERATELFIKYAQATVRGGVSYFDHVDKTPKTIEITLSTINGILGGNYDLSHVKNILDRLSFSYTVNKDVISVVRPTRRQDLTTYQDLIEEIGRISGYNALPNTLPKTVAIGHLSPRQIFRRSVRRILTGLGLNEVITYNLREKRILNDFTLNKTMPIVSIANPMSEVRNALVLTPLSGLIEVATHNTARKSDDVHLFELGTSYTQEQETPMLGMLMTGVYRNHFWKTTPSTDFYTLKSLFESLLNALGINKKVTYEKTQIKHYHPHQTAIILLEGEAIGHIGKVHPEKAKALDIKAVYLLEVNLDKLFDGSQTQRAYQALQRYPGVTRDIAIVCARTIPAQDLLDTIEDAGGRLLNQTHVFDVYEGAHVGEHQKSLGIRLLFEDANRTLETKDIDLLVEKIVTALTENHGASLR